VERSGVSKKSDYISGNFDVKESGNAFIRGMGVGMIILSIGVFLEGGKQRRLHSCFGN